MDAFENLVAQLLREDGFWVLQNVKINITKEDKELISKPTTPRPEVDIAAYNCKDNILYLIEAKSFIDSAGVKKEELFIEHKIQEGRYKLLTSNTYREVITDRLKLEFIEKGFINNKTKIYCGLIAGKIYKKEYNVLKEYFSNKNWFFWGPDDIKSKLNALSNKGYEDNSITMTVKLLQNDN